MKATTRQSGFTMMEVLVAISVLSIVALALANNTIKSYVFLKRSIRTSTAAQLALDKLESLAAVDPSTLDSSDSSSESNVTVDSVSFTRTTTVTVNTDSSRTITVSVVGNKLGGRATYQTTFPLWGNT